MVFREEYEDHSVQLAEAWAAEHRQFICAVFDVFTSTGRWPTPTALQRDLDRADVDIDIHTLSRELPRQLGPPWRGPDSELMLRIRALRHCERARSVLTSAMALLAVAYTRYKSPADTPKLVADDLTSPDLRAAAMVLQRETFHVVQGSHDVFVPEWEGYVNTALAREIKDVRTVGDYLECEAAYFRRNAVPASLAQGASTSRPLDRILNRQHASREEAQPEEAARSREPADARGQLAAFTTPRLVSDDRTVFVVHGRNIGLKDSMFEFLRAIDLNPLEFSEARRLTGKTNPYVTEVLDAAFEHARAVLVLMSPDDIAYLRSEFQNPGTDPAYERVPTGAPRLNVVFEAGMAMGRDSARTVLVECGSVRPFTDIGGRLALRLDNSVAQRQELAERLRTAGCAVIIQGRSDWHTAGNFQPADLDPAAPPESRAEAVTPPAPSTAGAHMFNVEVQSAVEGSRIFLRAINKGPSSVVLVAEVMDVVGLDREVVTPWPMRWRNGGDARDTPPGWPQLLLVADGDGYGNSREFRGNDPLDVGRWWFHTPGERIVAHTLIREGSEDLYLNDVDLRIRVGHFGGPAWVDVTLRIGFENREDPITNNLVVRAEVLQSEGEAHSR